jgi:hypothetical protein
MLAQVGLQEQGFKKCGRYWRQAQKILDSERASAEKLPEPRIRRNAAIADVPKSFDNILTFQRAVGHHTAANADVKHGVISGRSNDIDAVVLDSRWKMTGLTLCLNDWAASV